MDSSHTKEPALQCKSLCFFLKSFRSLFAKGREREAYFFLLCPRGKKKTHTKKKSQQNRKLYPNHFHFHKSRHLPKGEKIKIHVLYLKPLKGSLLLHGHLNNPVCQRMVKVLSALPIPRMNDEVWRQVLTKSLPCAGCWTKGQEKIMKCVWVGQVGRTKEQNQTVKRSYWSLGRRQDKGIK